MPSHRSHHLATQVITGLAVFTVGASLVGAAVVAALLGLFVSLPSADVLGPRALILIVSAAYLLLACVLGSLIGLSRHRRTLTWIGAQRDPTPEQARRALRIPVEIAVISAVLWLIGALGIGALTAAVATDGWIAVRVGLTIVLGGLTTSGVSYLMAARVARPVTALALAADPPVRRLTLGVAPQLLLTWLLASGVPILGVLLLYVDPSHLGGPTRGAIVLLVGISLVVGGAAMVLATRAISRPLRDLRRLVDRVGQGRYDRTVAVNDAGEIGLLQNGLNLMTAGLAERERLRDLFGRHVGVDVARRALDTGVALGGERRLVAALFVDITGSTALAEERGPAETVALLNRFFTIVVAAIEAGGGFVNKFQGDAALCVFGAPGELAGSATAALVAARRIATEVAAAGELRIGVGVAYGEVVAGQIGAESRLEYTVIGDAVNCAARLTELAKTEPGRVLTSAATVEAASPDEARRWQFLHTVTLRGRREATAVFAPVR